SFSLEPELLVWRRERHVGDESNGRLGDTRPVTGQTRRLHERSVHYLLVNELLDPVEDRLTLPAIQLGRLLVDEPFDVRIRTICEEATPSDKRIESGRRISKRRARALNNVLQPLLPILLEEGRALQWAKCRADAHCSPISCHCFGERRVRQIDGDRPGVEAIGVSRFRQELLGPPGVIWVER